MPETTKSVVPLKDALKVSDTIAEYSYLETHPTVRQAQRQLFTSDKIWAPNYVYPKLAKFLRHGELANDMSYEEMKSHALGAIHTLNEAQARNQVDPALAKLYIEFFEARVTRLLLLKTAQEMSEPSYAKTLPALRHRFRRLNESLYGHLDEKMWLEIMATERQRLHDTPLRGITAGRVMQKLYEFYDRIPESKTEAKLFDDDLRDTYRSMIHERYAKVLQVIPTTGDSVVYDARQCAAIMKNTLAVGGFNGWQVEVDPAKTCPSTDVNKKLISLPSFTKRTANELKRLVMHEQEVHARRGRNGQSHPEFSLLYYGTAKYAAVEEGLGLFLETMLSGMTNGPAVHRARDRYMAAGLALGCNGVPPKDARETFEPLWRIIAVRMASEGVITEETVYRAKNLAYSHIENAFRGTDFVSKGVIYSKLKVYYEGLHKNVAYMRSIADRPERLNDVFVGKYNHTDSYERQLVLDLIGHKQQLEKASTKLDFQVAYL